MSYRADYIRTINRKSDTDDYAVYTKSCQLNQLLDALIHLECAPHKNEFKFKHAFIPALEGKQKTLIKVKLVRNADGSPRVFCNSETFFKNVWMNDAGFMVKAFDVDKAQQVGENLYEDESGRIYNTSTFELQSAIKTDLDTFSIRTSSFKNEGNYASSIHSSKISKLYTTRNYSEKDNISSDSVWSGILDSNNSLVTAAYKLVLDLDNTYRNSKVVEVLKQLQFAPQLILKKNEYSNNEGSACAIWYFSSPIDSDMRRRLTTLLTYYIALTADTISIDTNYNNHQNHQNPVQVSTSNEKYLTHRVWIRSSNTVNVNSLETELMQYEVQLSEEEKAAITNISRDRQLLKSNQPFSKLIQTQHPADNEVRYMWNIVPSGHRNTTINYEIIQLIDEYLGMNGTEVLFENTTSISRIIHDILWPSVSSRYDNSDGQVTEGWCSSAVKRTAKWLKNKNMSDTRALNKGILYTYNIVKKQGVSMLQQLSGEEFNLSAFQYARTLKQESNGSGLNKRLQELRRERSATDQKFHSLFYNIATARNCGYFKDLLRIARENVKEDTSHTALQMLNELNNNYPDNNFNVNGAMKMISAIAQFARSENFIKTTQIDIKAVLAALPVIEINNTNDALSVTEFGHEKQVVTSITKNEKNSLLAVTWSDVLLTLSKAEQQAVLHFTFVETMKNICAEIDDLLENFSILEIKEDGEIKVSYSKVSQCKIEKKAFKNIFRAYNIPLSIMFKVYEPILNVCKSEAKFSDAPIICREMKNVDMKALRGNLARDTEEAFGLLLCKSALAEMNFKSFDLIADALQIVDMQSMQDIAESNQVFSTLYGLPLKLRTIYSADEYNSKLTLFTTILTKGVKTVTSRAKRAIIDLGLTREDFKALMNMLKTVIRKCVNIIKNTVKAAIIDIAERLHINLQSTSVKENEFASINFVEKYKQLLSYALAV